MARLLKCYGVCNRKYPKSDMKQISSKNYCVPCFNHVNEERRQRDLLYNYIKEVYQIDYPTGLMLKQIKEMTENNKYPLKNIRIAIKYGIFVSKLYTPEVKYGLAFVPFIYDRMRDYYIEQSRSSENSKKISNENGFGNEVIVKVKPYEKPSEQSRLNKKLLQM